MATVKLSLDVVVTFCHAQGAVEDINTTWHTANDRSLREHRQPWFMFACVCRLRFPISLFHFYRNIQKTQVYQLNKFLPTSSHNKLFDPLPPAGLRYLLHSETGKFKSRICSSRTLISERKEGTHLLCKC